MAHLPKSNKPDLLEICEEIGVEVDPSSKDAEIKKLILNSQLYAVEEEKIILDRVISDRKEQERIAREAKQHELEMKKLELSQRNQSLNDESGRRIDLGPKIQLIQITPKLDENNNEMGLYLINFDSKAELAQVPKKD
ncbi:uncharacterized protein NPIL_510301 [Nephila pilipes]|uniref:Uncharacterized protein n=1 Tax=Nephila pilipes TaxID=299642 RepID=A0A8X6Q9S1_NEPPI|nr:uncharacterized protein NPIL_510301 [Nephila pilipes]